MPSIQAVGAPETVHELERLAAIYRLLPDPDVLLNVLGMDELGPAPVFNLFE